MDLNPDSHRHLRREVRFLQQDCSHPWPLPESSLDVVFSSNFFEHLPEKSQLDLTLREILRCLKPGGRLIAVGPNIKFLHGIYWDFYDHHIYLTEASLGEALEIEGFRIEHITPKFLPFTMVKAPQYPMFFVRLYIAFPWVWRILGKQFLVMAQKPAATAGGGVESESEFRARTLRSWVLPRNFRTPPTKLHWQSLYGLPDDLQLALQGRNGDPVRHQLFKTLPGANHPGSGSR
jgi:SAM-dependent methyltransferase